MLRYRSSLNFPSAWNAGVAAISRRTSSREAASPIFSASASRSFRRTSVSRARFRRESAWARSGVTAFPYTSRYVFSSPAVASASSARETFSPPTVAATSRLLWEYEPTPPQMNVSAMKERMSLMAQEPAFRRSTSSMALISPVGMKTSDKTSLSYSTPPRKCNGISVAAANVCNGGDALLRYGVKRLSPDQERYFRRELMLINRILGLFSNDLAIDLGTATTRVYVKGGGIVRSAP